MDKSKEQTKPVKLEMLEYVSSVALLKSIRQVRKIHDVEAEDFIEKKLMDLGVRAVYPNQPFKYGYKRIYSNKKYLIKNPIGVRAPLTDEQLKIVAEFVGLAGLGLIAPRTLYRQFHHPFVWLAALLGLWSAAVSVFSQFPLASLLGTPQTGEGALRILGFGHYLRIELIH